MLELVTVALATFTALMALRAALPFTLPARLMPVAVAAIAYGITQLPAAGHRYVLAAACAGLVAVVHKLAVVQDPAPWPLRGLAGSGVARMRRWRRPRRRAPHRPVGHRIPAL